MTQQKETWQNAFLTAGTKEVGLDLSVMISTVSELLQQAEQRGADRAVDYKDSYKGKLWSTAIQKAFEAPFPEVAIQYLLNKVEQKTKIEALQEVLGMKREAVQEREAISPMAIVSVDMSEAPHVGPMTNFNIRQLQYVKVWDIEKLLEKARTSSDKGTN